MSKYINVDEFISFVDAGKHRNPTELCFSENDVINMIEKMSNKYCEDIVLCKNCKYWQYTCQGDFDFIYGDCLWWSIEAYREWYPETTGNDFCSNGRVRTEDE